jgi:hypothetical protein
MRPDLQRDIWTGWGVCAGATILTGLAIYFFSDDGGLEGQLKTKHATYATLGGPVLFADVIQQQKAANQVLRRTIDDRKNDTGFVVARRFRVEPSDIPAGSGFTPGGIFQKRFGEVRQEIKDLAYNRHVGFEPNLGFGSDGTVPADKDVPYLLTMLQLTQKACRIALDKDVKPLTFFSITHGKAQLTGPDGRPNLIQEYPITLTVTGDLVDVLHILWQFSQVAPHIASDPEPQDYPLVLQGLDITSNNAKPADQIQDVTAVFKIAGMRYLSDSERANGISIGFPQILHADQPPASAPTAPGAPAGTPAPPRLPDGNASAVPAPAGHNGIGAHP